MILSDSLFIWGSVVVVIILLFWAANTKVPKSSELIICTLCPMGFSTQEKANLHLRLAHADPEVGLDSK